MSGHTKRQAVRDQNDDYAQFRETLARPISNHGYRDRIQDNDARSSMVADFVRLIAVTLNLLLMIRFIMNLFTGNPTGWVAGLVNDLTDWIVSPIHTFLPATINGTVSVFIWADLIAIAVVTLVATAIIRLTRHSEV